jgi:hypothetical protein
MVPACREIHTKYLLIYGSGESILSERKRFYTPVGRTSRTERWSVIPRRISTLLSIAPRRPGQGKEIGLPWKGKVGEQRKE